MTGRDHRSVGELLLDAEHTARDVLIDLSDLNAAAMLRTWPEVVQTAASLWSVLPTPSVTLTASSSATDPMARVAAMTAVLHRGSRSGRWPGPGPTEPRLQSIADSFARAAELVDRHGAPHSGNPAVRADADAARTRIIHTLYLTAHGVRLAVLEYVRSIEATLSPRSRITAPGGLSVPRSFLNRLDAVEQVAGAYVTRTYPVALAGEHRQAPLGSRVATALAAWDVHAHRAIAAHPTAGHLRLVARTQELVLGHAAVLLSAAAHTGAIDKFQYATRLEQPLDSARAAWAASGRSWAQLAAHGARPDLPALTGAAAEARAALREITVDGSSTAARDVIVARIDLTAAARTLATVLSSSTDLAHLIHDVATDPAVTFPARAVNAAAIAASTTPRGGVVPGSGDAAHVGIKDLTSNREIPLTPVVRDREAHRAEQLITANQAAAHAGVWLPRPTMSTSSPKVRIPASGLRLPQPVRARSR
ncbi:hypothetical protein JNB_01010 [Janibacter sp. HTCC2649]|uniref:hypothetical protein n=1 Tax=Janibacter sp. HTCC2649 TaxID=313589 RepID=UPI000066EC62|nr:hypothetical protein [Janibacter sp. HTCC2649]EAP98704.1 hypothetical protein JNB_01010 [Janibacter sp. HTCC2649]